MNGFDRLEAINLIKTACANGARKHKACEILDISIRTYERWIKEDGTKDKRKNAERIVGNKLSEKEKESILTIVNSEKYRDLPPCKIVPMLADEGFYIASESSIYRILREENLLAHRQLTKAAKRKRPDACEADAPNHVWSWDITYLPSHIAGQYFYLYMIVDIFSRKIVGWSVHDKQTAEHASDLIREACSDENISPHQLKLHSDNGSPMKGSTMLATLQVLGVLPSFSRPSVSDDNPYSEALFKTLKYHPTFPALSNFESIGEARQWCIKFVDWYNNQHLHSGLKFITPHQRHVGEDKVIMAKRDQVYKLAKLQRPDRWSRHTRNWNLPDRVTLNPDRKRMKASMHDERNLMQAA